MAIILFGPMVTGARGKINGLIFSANGAGPFVRGWSRSSNPRSPAQAEVRNRLASFSTAWADLTAAERDDWDDYAAQPAQELTNSLSETYVISGQAWFIRINSHLDEAGASSRVDAPTLTRKTAPTIEALRMEATGSSGDSNVRLPAASPDLSEIHLVGLRFYYSKGRQTATSGFRHVYLALPTAVRFLVFQPEMEAQLGSIPIDTKGFVEVAVQDSQGQRGPVAVANAITITTP